MWFAKPTRRTPTDDNRTPSSSQEVLAAVACFPSRGEPRMGAIAYSTLANLRERSEARTKTLLHVRPSAYCGILRLDLKPRSTVVFASKVFCSSAQDVGAIVLS